MIALGVLSFPNLPRTICYDDGGDLQIASIELGIAHPPGYAALVSFGHLWVRVLSGAVEPAFAVTLMFWLLGLLAAGFMVHLAQQCGASPWLSPLTALAFFYRIEAAEQLLFPEVYLPSLAVTLAAIWGIQRGIAGHSRLWVFLGAALLGVGVGLRPVMGLVALGYCVLWLLARGWRDAFLRQAAGWGSVAVLAGVLYGPAYVLLRDVRGTHYNYISSYQRSERDIPPQSDRLSDRLERLHWHLSARQFHHFLGFRAHQVRYRLGVLYRRLIEPEPRAAAAVIGLTLLGAWLTVRRTPIVAAPLLLAGLGSFAFACVYDVQGWESDLLPMLALAGVGSVVAIAWMLRVLGPSGLRAVGLLACLCMLVLLYDRRFGPYRIQRLDAAHYVRHLDAQSLPQHAVLITEWFLYGPTYYAVRYGSTRTDIDIFCVGSNYWEEWIRKFQGPAGFTRPVYCTAPRGDYAGLQLERFRNVWQVVPGP